MLNEPVQESGQGGGGSGGGGGGGGGIAAEAGSRHMNYIQVTPQEKEAIERVSRASFKGSGSGKGSCLLLSHLIIN